MQSGFLGAPGASLEDQPVEGGLPPERPEYQFLCQASVDGLEGPEIGAVVEPILGKVSRSGLIHQEPGGKLSWCGNHPAGILTPLRRGARF